MVGARIRFLYPVQNTHINAGAHSWVRKNIGIRMDGDATSEFLRSFPIWHYSSPSCSDSVWGVIDLEADTDFPDIRNQTFVHSDEGVLFIVPRENDLNRLYIQQPESDLLDPATGRVDKDRTSPEKILDEARKILSPYKLEVKNGRVDWWTVYTGECCYLLVVLGVLTLTFFSWSAGCDAILGFRSCIHRWRCVPHPYTESRCVRTRVWTVMILTSFPPHRPRSQCEHGRHP